MPKKTGKDSLIQSKTFENKENKNANRSEMHKKIK